MKSFTSHRNLRAGGALAFALCLGAGATQAQDARTVYPIDINNIAAASNGGRIISVSSTLEEGNEFRAENLIDGQVYNGVTKQGSAGWASNKYDPVSMDYVTLGFTDNTVRRIGKIVLNPNVALAPERWAKDVEIQVSTESAEGPYRAVAQLTLKRAAERQEFVILPAQARFVRLMFRSNWGSDRAVGLGEVEIYEAIPQTDPMGQLIAGLQSAINDLNRYKSTQSDVRVASTGDMGAASTRTVASEPQLSAATVQLIQALEGDATTTETAAKAPAATPAQAARRGSNSNIAAAANGGRIVDVTSTFNNDPAYAAEQVIDGQNYSFDKNTGPNGWASQGFVPGREWVTIGFRDDRTHVINKVIINPVSNQSSLRWASRVEVQVTTESAKDGPFRTVAALNIRQEAVNQDFKISPVEAKYVRFVFTANGGGNPLPNADPNVGSDRAVSVGEIEIYQPDISTSDLEAIIGRFNLVLTGLIRLRGQQQAAGTTATATTTAATTG
jgi:hypothetical protein